LKNKLPKRKSARLKDYDYAKSNVVFFLTVCAQFNRKVFENPDFNSNVLIL